MTKRKSPTDPSSNRTQEPDTLSRYSNIEVEIKDVSRLPPKGIPSDKDSVQSFIDALVKMALMPPLESIDSFKERTIRALKGILLNKLPDNAPQNTYLDITRMISILEHMDISDETINNAILSKTAYKAPRELYRERPDRSETALTFLKRVWGIELASGTLYQFQLKRLDNSLLVALRNHARYHNLDMNTILPSRGRLTETVATQSSQSQFSPLERAKAAEALARRLGRAARKKVHPPK